MSAIVLVKLQACWLITHVITIKSLFLDQLTLRHMCVVGSIILSKELIILMMTISMIIIRLCFYYDNYKCIKLLLLHFPFSFTFDDDAFFALHFAVLSSFSSTHLLTSLYKRRYKMSWPTPLGTGLSYLMINREVNCYYSMHTF